MEAAEFKAQQAMVMANMQKAEPLEWGPLWAAMDTRPEEWIPTTENMYLKMLEYVPPRAQVLGAFLVGEPLRHIGGKAVHACFKRVGSDFFARNLTVEQFNTSMIQALGTVDAIRKDIAAYDPL